MAEADEARLAPLREAIDAVDRRLVELLNERARLAVQVGELKRDAGAPVYRPDREAAVLERVAGHGVGPLAPDAVQAIFREVISACRAIEQPLAVGYLGPAGTFSEAALLRQFGSRVEAVACGTIDEVFRAVEAGRLAYGVVPVENSSEGAVNRTLDLLLSTTLSIVAEVAVPVEHHLLSASGTLDGVTRVAAHPQALAQCQGWLAEHAARLERVPLSSNGEAARCAAADPQLAAIAGEAAAQRYGLLPVARLIHDDPHNRTRFLVVGRSAAPPSGRDKTSLVLSVPNRAGAVHHMLAPLAEHGVSMTRFESRPARSADWAYYFYVDVEGHAGEPRVAAALEALRRACAYYKCLGSYPVAG